MGGKMLNLKGQSDKKSKNIIGIIQSCLILVLVILIIFMMIQISWLQGCLLYTSDAADEL